MSNWSFGPLCRAISVSAGLGFSFLLAPTVWAGAPTPVLDSAPTLDAPEMFFFFNNDLNFGQANSPFVPFGVEFNKDGTGPILPDPDTSFFDIQFDRNPDNSISGTVAITGTIPSEGFNSGNILLGNINNLQFAPDGDFIWTVDVTGGDAQSFFDPQIGVVLNITNSNCIELTVNCGVSGIGSAGNFFPLDINLPPVANPGGPYAFDVDNQTIQLDGSASADVDGSIVSAQWGGGPAVIKNGLVTDLQLIESGLLTTTSVENWTLVVTDDDGASDQNSTTVSYDNTAPGIGSVSIVYHGNSAQNGVTAIASIVDRDMGVNADIPGFERLTLDLADSLGAIEGTVDIDEAFFKDLSNELLIFPETGEKTLIITDRASASDSIEILVDEGVTPGSETVFLQSGSPAEISQIVDVPLAPFNLEFDFWFDTSTGALMVLLDGVELAEFLAADFLPGDMNTAFIPIGDPFLGLEDVELAFVLDGPHGSLAFVDNVIWPGLLNGDFEGGTLDNWTPSTEGQAIVGLAQFNSQSASVPEPSTLSAFSVGLLSLGILGYRRR